MLAQDCSGSESSAGRFERSSFNKALLPGKVLNTSRAAFLSAKEGQFAAVQ